MNFKFNIDPCDLRLGAIVGRGRRRRLRNEFHLFDTVNSLAWLGPKWARRLTEGKINDYFTIYKLYREVKMRNCAFECLF